MMASAGAGLAEVDEGVPPEPLVKDPDVAVFGTDTLPAEVAARIVSFLCVRDIGRLACAARHFVTPVLSDCTAPGATARLSIVDEGARLATLRRGATLGSPPPHAGSRAPCDRILHGQLWMRYLWELENPLPSFPASPELVPMESLQGCGPGSWSTIHCDGCGRALGQGFNLNCRCGGCPCPPMVPVQECDCMRFGGALLDPLMPMFRPPSPLMPLTFAETGDIELPSTNDGERYVVSPSCVFPAVDSTSIRSDPLALASRFRELGYLAFSNFFSDELTRPVADKMAFVHSRCATVGSDPVPGDFEANLYSGASWSAELVETWRGLGNDPTFTRLNDDGTLLEQVAVLSTALGYAGSPSLLPQFTFVRGKGSGAGTTPHVDFRTSDTTGAGLDKTQPGFICWVSVRVPKATAKQSELCLSPCSHQQQAQTAQKDTVSPNVLPPMFQAKIDAGQAQWHVLNQESGLAGTGTLVLMDLQLVHGATIGSNLGDTDGVGAAAGAGSAGVVDTYRYSWDSRIVCGSGTSLGSSADQGSRRKVLASAPTSAAVKLSKLRKCGPGQWTTVNCHGCGAALGQGFRSNCYCGQCPRPPMVPVRKCPCGGVRPKSAKLKSARRGTPQDIEASSDDE
jgi:hypothetical protein